MTVPPRSANVRGAALISAMITVTLVATLATAALWQQWRNVEIETAERSHAQTSWLLTGALDFTRLVLREDKGPADHLAEPWSLGLQESKLSAFLSQDQQMREGDPEVFLSGQITDAQSRLNVMNLIGTDGKPSTESLASFAKLFNLLDLPLAELSLMSQQLQAARLIAAEGANQPAANPKAPLLPQTTAQLVWLGISASTVSALAPFVCILPRRTELNLNTASAQALFASIPSLDIAAAQQFVRERANRPPLEDLAAATKALGNQVNAAKHSIKTDFFEIRGRLRLDDLAQEDVLLVERNGPQVKILWRYRAFQNQLGPAPDGRLLQSDKS
jgi:general secretion pathway protein K